MNKVYILGAGASAGYDKSKVSLCPPTSRDFFQRAMDLIDDKEKESFEEQRFQNLFKYLDKYYSLKKEDLRIKDIDIEEVLTILDLETSENEFNEARRELLEMVYLTLNEILYGERCPYHKKLIENLKSTDTIITFNWDLLLDNIFSEKEDIPNYKYKFSKYYQNGKWENFNSITYSNSPALIKLHGSLNWMKCNDCEKDYCYILSGKVAADQIINPEDTKTKCPECDKKMEPIIIPPTLAKKYKSKVFDELWKEALNALKDASEIVIIGYSLPITDFRVKWLFMKSVAMRKKPIEKLTLVDKYPDNLCDKYKNLFRINDDKFICIKGGIKEYTNMYDRV